MFKELDILKPFFEDPQREYGIRELARETHITPTTAGKWLRAFAKEGILFYRNEHMLELYKAHLNSPSYFDLKVYWTLRQIRASGIIESLNAFYLKPTIILFGSCAKGLDTKQSDMDLAIISEKTKDFAQRQEFEKKLKKTIQIFAVKKLGDLRNPHLINNVRNGIVLQGDVQ